MLALGFYIQLYVCPFEGISLYQFYSYLHSAVLHKNIPNYFTTLKYDFFRTKWTVIVVSCVGIGLGCHDLLTKNHIIIHRYIGTIYYYIYKYIFFLVTRIPTYEMWDGLQLTIKATIYLPINHESEK